MPHLRFPESDRSDVRGAPARVLSRRFRLQPRGAVFLVLAGAVGIAAAQRGNNLLFVVFSALIGLFLSDAILTLMSARKLDISRILPEMVHGTQPFSVTLRLWNRKRLVPLVRVRIEDRLSQDGRWAALQPPPVIVPYGRPGRKVRSTFSVSVHQRGWARFGPVTVTSEFPPGLVACRVTLDIQDQVLVLPRPGVISRSPQTSLAGRLAAVRSLRDLASTGDEFAGVREYRPGDNLRRIHWRTSARLPQRLFVRELEDTHVREAIVILDTFLPNPGDLRGRSRLERAISFAIALTSALLEEGAWVRFRAAFPESTEMALDPSRRMLSDLERALALIAPSLSPVVSDLLALSSPNPEAFTFVLLAGDAPPALPERGVTIPADEMRRIMFYAS
ncbi:MAG: DUF58 domain-containing protein [Planctomycetes bacterium]|nr:DUF58 domain-containing protein [Planctomycetota bacterium]